MSAQVQRPQPHGPRSADPVSFHVCVKSLQRHPRESNTEADGCVSPIHQPLASSTSSLNSPLEDPGNSFTFPKSHISSKHSQECLCARAFSLLSALPVTLQRCHATRMSLHVTQKGADAEEGSEQLTAASAGSPKYLLSKKIPNLLPPEP